MTTEPHGRYGTLGDVERCIPAPDEPKPIFRLSIPYHSEDKLQKAIAHTGCTITEGGGIFAHIIHSPGDNIHEAQIILASKGITNIEITKM